MTDFKFKRNAKVGKRFSFEEKDYKSGLGQLCTICGYWFYFYELKEGMCPDCQKAMKEAFELLKRDKIRSDAERGINKKECG